MLKNFYAQYKGSFLPDKFWDGIIQSVYSKAVNIEYPSGILISIVKSPLYMTDYGISVADFGIMVKSVVPGKQFLWRRDKLFFSDITIDISGACGWSGHVFNKKAEISLKKIEQLKGIYREYASEEGLSPVITSKRGNIYSNAVGKIINDAAENSNISDGLFPDLSKLVGLGIGFTPSGDDFLTGVMLFEVVFGTKVINREAVRAKLLGTTEGGRTLLSLALKNSFPNYLKQFVKAIVGNNYPLQIVVQKVMKHGSTSGSDALTGFLWAAEKNEKTGKLI